MTGGSLVFGKRVCTFLLLLGTATAKEFTIRNDRDLLTAINTVGPGDVIQLNRDTTYYLQNVELNRNGRPHSTISLVGAKGTRIKSDNTALTIGGSFWRIQNIAFETSRRGIVVYGNNNTFKSLSFHDIEDEGIDIRGQGNMVRSCVFNGVNHGIIVNGRDNTLYKNSLTCSASTVTVSSRSCCGRLEGNVFNGLLNVFGGDYDVVKNVANSDVAISGQRNDVKGNVINGRMDVSGCGNSFFGNTAGRTDFTPSCYNWDDGENHFGSYIGNIHNSHYPHSNNINSHTNHNNNHQHHHGHYDPSTKP